VVSDGFVKPPQTPCLHCTGRACAIYDHRPRVCAGYQCGWRFLPWIPRALRPDKARVLFDALRETPTGHGLAVSILALDGREALEGEAVRAIIAKLVESGVAVYFAKLAGPGELFELVLGNDALARPVADRDETGLTQALERIGRTLDAPSRRNTDAGLDPGPAPARAAPGRRAKRAGQRPPLR
jgi:hypothetical protein